jgi:hypothetical protein
MHQEKQELMPLQFTLLLMVEHTKEREIQKTQSNGSGYKNKTDII